MGRSSLLIEILNEKCKSSCWQRISKGWREHVWIRCFSLNPENMHVPRLWRRSKYFRSPSMYGLKAEEVSWMWRSSDEKRKSKAPEDGSTNDLLINKSIWRPSLLMIVDFSGKYFRIRIYKSKLINSTFYSCNVLFWRLANTLKTDRPLHKYAHGFVFIVCLRGPVNMHRHAPLTCSFWVAKKFRLGLQIQQRKCTQMCACCVVVDKTQSQNE